MASTRLTRTVGAGNRQTWTWSGWIKRASIGSSTNILFGTYVHANDNFRSYFQDTDAFSVRFYNGTEYIIATNRLFRDTSAWYHMVIVADTTNATSGDRFRLYVNGERETSLTDNSQPPQNTNMSINDSNTLEIGSFNNTYFFDGSMSHIHFIDGTAYDASDFGEYDTNGVWKIKTSPSVTYGTNGFFILKDGNSVTDQSPNTNNFTVGGGTLTKTEDSPSNVFATFNPLVNSGTGSTNNPIYLNGNTRADHTGTTNAFSNSRATLGFTTGKYYAEFKITADDSNMDIGIINMQSGFRSSNNHALWYQQDGAVALRADGSIVINSVTSGTTFSGFASSDILQVAFDRTNKKIWLGEGGTWFNSGDPSNGTNELLNLSATIGDDEFWTFAVGGYLNTGSNEKWDANFGNGFFGTTAVASAGTNASGIGIFEYDVPTGYTALCTKGLNL